MDVNRDSNANTERVGTLGRETYRDPLVNFDLRLARRIRLAERLDAEVIAEAFNICNSLNVTDIDTVDGAANHEPLPILSRDPSMAL